MPGPDLVALNATMTDTILDGPPQPLVDGGYALRVLYTTGRRSGRRRPVPTGVVVLGDRRYLVCPDPRRDWARNLAADPRCVIASRDGEEAFTEEIRPHLGSLLVLRLLPPADGLGR